MNTVENKQIMARNIKKYMEKKGVTNQQICDALNFKYTTFLDWTKAVTYPRIGKIEAMANYFGCEKSDLIEDKKEQPTENDGLSPNRKALMQFAMEVPEDKAAMILQVMRTILQND